jgi:CMP-N-acetylneuraminic acid synthetase
VRLWDNQTRPVNHDPEILLCTQDLPPIYEENSCLYIFSEETLVKRQNRIGKRPLLFEIDRLEAWDIDEELDFEIAEYLYLKYRQEK